MRWLIDHRAMPVCGYTEPWSVRAGATASLHVSGAAEKPRLHVVRLDDPDDGADGWRITERAAPMSVEPIERGSWIELPLLRTRLTGSAWALRLECLFTRNTTRRCVIALGNLSVWLEADGRIGVESPPEKRYTESPLTAWSWMELALHVRPERVALEIGAADGAVLELSLSGRADAPERVLIGTNDDPAQPTVNARFGRMNLFIESERVAAWRFPTRGPVSVLPPALGDWPPLRLHNMPTISVASARWDGTVHDPRLAPEQYDAVHCHEDDMAPLTWPAYARLSGPDDAESGVYAVELTAGAGVERIPFFVRPARPSAPIAFLVPTLTYLAYADERLPRDRFEWRCEDRGHVFAQDNGLLSLYDVHADGSGVSMTTTRRPKATLRDDSLYPLCGCPHLLPVDLRLLQFCHRAGIAFDVLTDHDLHREGVKALDGYAGVFTGSHPEYWTTPTQDALSAFLDRGGSLAYLGGNGFMWVAAVSGDLMEVRRGRTLAARTWSGRPGETTMTLSGEIGGLWRERGRSEFALVGTGMTMMGFGPARPYTRAPASFSDAYAWIFEGVTEDPLGNSGAVLGAAAGYEVDRVDAELGTPPGTVVLATASGFDDSYSIDGNDWFATRDARALARVASMTVRTHRGGGFVFAVGSVAWCGALPARHETNAVGRITANVLHRLATPA